MSLSQADLFPKRHLLGAAIKQDPAAALSLFSASGVGSARFRALLGAFGSPVSVLSAGERALKEVPGVDVVTATAIRQAGQDGTGQKLHQMLLDCAARILSIWDDGYPALLKEIHDPPALLFIRGALPSADETCFAIVGTRNPSIYGVKQAHVIAADLAAAGLSIVSGMARGIDTAAHEGALQASGKTYAVFGCGIDVIYPAENRSLAEKISASGGLISEFLPGMQPDAGLFPRRNRVISGLCRGVLVVQGSETSGALITARCALEQNREVFALPGNVEDRRSQGPHQLIRQGANLVETAKDVLDSILGGASVVDSAVRVAPVAPLIPSEAALVARLSCDPIHIDQLVRDMDLPVASVLADLLGLEMKNWVVQLPGKLFALK